MKRIIFSVLALMSVCISINAQIKVLVNKSSGDIDTYQFDESTKITFCDGNIKFNSPSKSMQYSPLEIKNVTFGANVSSITLNQTSATIEEGDKITLTATVFPANAINKEVLWSSTNENVAMVSQGGVVHGLSEGTTTITATSTDGSGVKASCTLNVVPVKVKSINLNYSTYTLYEGEAITLEATVLPQNAKNKEVTWESSNEDVVMVSRTGRVVFLDYGDATVTATAKDGSGISATCVFTCTTGVVSVSSEDGKIKIFDVNGSSKTNVGHGINIIKMHDGTFKKLIVK